MAVTYSKAGRPRFVADIDLSIDWELPLRDEFHKLCSDFCYRDIMALSRALGVQPITVRFWKYGLSYPRRGMALQIIDWVNAGKPMKQVHSVNESFEMI